MDGVSFEALKRYLRYVLQTTGIKVSGRSSNHIVVASNADISSGVTATLPPLTKWTLFLHANGAVDVDIYLSPDDTNWFKVPESPVSFSAAGDQIIEMGYVAEAVKLVGSNTTAVTAIIYYVV